MNTYDEWAGMLDDYRSALGPQALKHLHIHLSGIEYGEKGEKNHLPLEEADLNLDAIFRALSESGCGGRILCESPVMEEDAQLMRQRWIALSGEAEA